MENAELNPKSQRLLPDLIGQLNQISHTNAFRVTVNEFIRRLPYVTKTKIEITEKFERLEKGGSEIDKHLLQTMIQNKEMRIGQAVIKYRVVITSGTLQMCGSEIVIPVVRTDDGNVIELESVIISMNQVWSNLFVYLMEISISGWVKEMSQQQTPPKSYVSFG